MHVGDGQLSGPVLAVGGVLAAGGVYHSLSGLDDRKLPRVAVLSSLLLAASSWPIPLPMPGTSVHLVLAGLLGILLGWETFLAMPLVLGMQALMLGHGAVTAIGVNVLAMALPGPILARLARPALASRRRPWVFWSGFGVGAGSVLLATGIVSAAYLASDWQYARYVPIFVAVHASLAAVEGVITGSTAVYLSRVRPSLLDAGLARVSSEVAHVS